jgi:lycopene cyclase-like protein
MWLMDYRALDSHTPPSFLYAIPEGRTTLFVQETVLASRDPIDMAVLSARLDRRIARLGLRVRGRYGEEHCVIPLGVGLPIDGGGALPFGAAAGFVNPVSGYQLGRALERSEQVAHAAARGADRHSILEAIWPPCSRHAFQLYHFALANMLRLPPSEFRNFIHGFFGLPEGLWLGFMTGTQTRRQVLSTLWRLFGDAPNSLRLELLRGAMDGGLAAMLPSPSKVRL